MSKTSKVWSYAKRVDESTAKCNLCEMIFSARGGNTSTVRHHLIGTHHINIDGTDSKSGSSPNIASFFAAPRTKLTKLRINELDTKVAEFIARDARPISLVEGEGFRSLMKFLEPDYELKCRTTTTALIKEMYKNAVERLKIKLGKTEYIAFTTDMWTSMQNIAYMCVTAHWLNENWELESAILQTRETPERHTGENISIRLQATADEWGIPGRKIAATVHDNGSNINLAMNFLDDWPDQRCFAHTLQLAIGAGLKIPAIAQMLGAARRLAAHFKRSTVAMEALRTKQAALKTSETDDVLEIIIDCSTRWNSSLDMLDRLVKLRWAIGAVLSDPNVTAHNNAKTFKMTDDNWYLAQAMISLLKPLKQVTTMSSGQKYPSLSSIYPQMFIVLRNVEASKPDDSAVIQQCRRTISDQLRQRYYPTGFSTLNGPKASVFDPRYKLLKIFAESSRQETYAAVRSELETIDAEEADATEPAPKRTRVENENIFDDLAALCAADDSLNQSDELATYLGETPLSVNSDILQFWHDNRKRYAKLSTLARKYLCIPATSVPSESAFSTAGHIVNRRRASLAPDTVDMLVFLNRNWELCFEK